MKNIIKKSSVRLSFRLRLWILLTSLFYLISCSTPKNVVEKYNDVIRIDPAKEKDYSTLKTKNEVMARNGYYLEGTVLKIYKYWKHAECPANDSTPVVCYDSTIKFRDKNAADNEFEFIKFSDIISIGREIGNLQNNAAGNIDLFETSNNPFLPDQIRQVKIDSIFTHCPNPDPTKDTSRCPCRDISLGFDISLECPDCKYSWWFLDLAMFYAVYSDFDAKEAEFRYRTDKSAEIIAGLRFEKFQVGLLYNFGIDVSNYYDFRVHPRPLLALFGKYKFDKVFCVNPYVYGLIGTATDKYTMDYIKKSNYDPISNADCPCNFGFPFSIGLGLGLEIPIPSCLFGITLDLGWRSLAIGQSRILPDLSESLYIRRLDTWNFRFGITF